MVLKRDLLQFMIWRSFRVQSKMPSEKAAGEISENGTSSQSSTFIKQEDLASGKWLKLSNVYYADPTGRQRVWEVTSRTTKVAGDLPDAVVIIPILRRNLHYDCTILVKQFRPAFCKYTIEFPAGLLDPNETVETCAKRELKEETGYTGVVKHSTPASALDGGMSNSTAQFLTVQIDGDLPENQNPEQKSEFIEVLTVPMDELLSKLNEYSTEGMVVDSRLYMYALAMEHTKGMVQPKTPK
ncbi:ADP-sugar pyrophosphatase-like isoform X2 [Dreissena polymorpha]|uniref:ADP-sugar pyrophosphatase-like isoform X2 n=1 Tax=Dreissena polymorpha TaxID=45954 RepID=UPI002264B896|nr:ADP-sugar pyrophosphatase-like isoform X2 [Dreissena polymorpha]